MGFFAYIKRKINEALDEQEAEYERELQASREPEEPTSVVEQIRATGSRAQFERKHVDSSDLD